MGSYAAGTEVSVSRSQEEIDRILQRFGAGQSAWIRDDEKGLIRLMFRRKGVNYAVAVTMPKPDAFATTPSGRFRRTASAQIEEYEKERRRRIRSLANYIKAKLAAIEDGIVSDETAMLEWAVLADGRTVGDHYREEIHTALQQGQMPRTMLREGTANEATSR